MADKDKPQTALTVQQRAGALATEAMARFQKLDGARRTRLLAAAALLVACFAGLLWYATRTDWRTLYAGLDPDDARQMAQELTAAGIPFDVSTDGAALRVPAEDLDKARLATTAKGGPKSGRMGFELFDKPNWMGSEFDEKVNYQRALEGELEHTIGTLASVESARVHLVLPHDSLFTTEERDAKASVVLRLRHRTLSDDEAEAVSNLVASAVDGLRPENVVLVATRSGAAPTAWQAMADGPARPVVPAGGDASQSRKPLQGAVSDDETPSGETTTLAERKETQPGTTTESEPVAGGQAAPQHGAAAAGSPASGAQRGGAGSAQAEAPGRQAERNVSVLSRTGKTGMPASGAAPAAKKAESSAFPAKIRDADPAQHSATGEASGQKGAEFSPPTKIPAHAVHPGSTMATAQAAVAPAAQPPVAGPSGAPTRTTARMPVSAQPAQRGNPGEKNDAIAAEKLDRGAVGGVESAAHPVREAAPAEAHDAVRCLPAAANAGTLPSSPGAAPSPPSLPAAGSAGTAACAAPVQHFAATSTTAAGQEPAASAEHGSASAAFERMDVAAAPRVLESAPQRLSVGVRDSGLGWIEVRTHATAGQVSAVLASASSEAHSVLSAHLPEMREYLAAQQVRVDQLSSHQYSSSAGDRDASSRNEAQGGKPVQPGMQNQNPSPAITADGGEESLSYINVRV